ncbi:hypothetical protein M2G93_18975 [Vibrio vulnificus]|uniref:hypothetical protein n=1 Tax=Vibrio vulnificus TaxID=672 RepID=UPI0021D90143|nr:hypothetical protein [Vibrio vulnificus]EKZ9225791.1 hypothetical protein [Vibrio vulnificus]ELC9582630.1 hypothetical protein [Vibrio vulnificus]MCU8150206.1 hypothetical protein [Vibrio vulnificus]MCU8385886.1 hypothetical protein [Vibrio vulnificus]
MARKTNPNSDASAFVTPQKRLLKPTALVLDDSEPFDFDKAIDAEPENEAMTSELLSGKKEIHLPLGRNKEPIPFELWVLQPDEIESQTIPHPENARKMEFFSKLDRQIAKEMIASEGINLYPAVGQLNHETNLVELMDGLRRSVGCLEGGFPFQVYVTKHEIVPQRAHALSVNANKHVTNGLLDRRYLFKKDGAQIQLRRSNDGFPPLSDNKLIEALNVSKPIYSAAMKSFDVPDTVFQLFPSPSTLGRPTLNKLYKYVLQSNLSDKQLSSVYEKVRNFVAETNFTLDSNDANSRAMKVFETEVKKLLAATTPRSKDEKYELADNLGYVQRSGNGGVSIQLTSLSKTGIDAVLAQLKAMLEDESE